jgi:D-3-phosphoglycerate dehydrogenase / 2-oxoglutarate reductase
VKKIALADRETEKMGIPQFLQEYDVKLPKSYFSDEDELVSNARDAEAIMAVLGKVPRKVIESAERLKIIAVAAAGFDNVDVATATSRGIFVTRAGTADVEPIAEHAIAFMIMLSKKILTAIDEVRKGNWDFRKSPEAVGREITRKTAGIIGIGNVGLALAKKALGIGMNVLAYDPWVSPSVAERSAVNLVSLEELLQRCDYVCVTCALTKETRGMIGTKELKMMGKHANLINVARGGIVDEVSLCQALAEGWIAGAALDVLEQEPPPNEHPLMKLSNCIITPHIAGLAIERYTDCGRVAVEEVKRVLNGGMPRPENLVNPELLKRK